MNRKNSSKISYKIYHTHLIVRENVSAKINIIYIDSEPRNG